MIKIIDKYLVSKIWLHTIAMIYICSITSRMISDHHCCCILSLKLSMVVIYILNFWVGSTVIRELDEDDEDDDKG